MPFFGLSQSVDQPALDVLSLNQAPQLPKNILSSRSIVLISVPKDSPAGEWKKWAAEMQASLSQFGVDAVAYLSIDQLAENTVAQKELNSDIFSKRGISNLITLSVLDKEGTALMTVGPYNRKWTFFEEKSAFWMRQVSDIGSIWSELETVFKTGAFPRTNLLVLDSPEYFDLTISFTSRTERFTKLMETQKVAVPMFVALQDDPNRILRLKSDILTGKEDRGVAATTSQNAQLSEIIAQYPFEAELVNLNEKSEDQWLRSGYGFILHHATGTESDLRSKLKYKSLDKSSNKTLTKYYLKQLRTSNLYLGREWDAGNTPTTALTNFVERVRTEFKSDN